MEPIYSADDVAAQLGMSGSRVRQAARRWGLGQKVGREWIFRDVDVEAIRNRQGLVGSAGHELLDE